MTKEDKCSLFVQVITLRIILVIIIIICSV